MTNEFKMRAVTLTLAADLAVLAVVCIFWTPYDPARLLRPIPAAASAVTLHDNLGPRLETLATNVFLAPLLGPDKAIEKKLESRRWLMRVLASRATAVAFIPGFDRFTADGAPSSAPALAVTSWAGAWTPLLRWALWLRAPEEILPAGTCDGHRLWAYRRPFMFCGSPAYFSFALDEGLFIGCLSREGNGVARLLRIEGLKGESMPVVEAMQMLNQHPAQDRAIIKINPAGGKSGRPFLAACAVEKLDGNRLSAAIRFRPAIESKPGGMPAPAMATAGKIFGRGPAIIACAPQGLVVEAIEALSGSSWQQALKPIIAHRDAANGLCVLSVFTGDLGGRFGTDPLRITVPTLVLSVAGIRPDQARAAVPVLLGLINARYRLALAVNPSLPPAGNWQLYGIEAASGKWLRSMPADDLPAYAFYGDWLMLASNGAGLRKLLLEMESGAPCGPGAWPLLFDGQPRQAFLRIAPGEGGKALRFGLMLASVMLEGEGHGSSGAAREALRGARAWLEGLSGMRDISAWLENDAGETVMRIEIAGKGMKK